MKIVKLTRKIKPPCPKCPYRLGLVETLIDPCPQCEINGYQSYEWFQKQLSEKTLISKQEAGKLYGKGDRAMWSKKKKL